MYLGQVEPYEALEKFYLSAICDPKFFLLLRGKEGLTGIKSHKLLGMLGLARR